MCATKEEKQTHDQPFARLRPVEGVLGVTLFELDEEDLATVEVVAVLRRLLTLLDVLAGSVVLMRGSRRRVNSEVPLRQPNNGKLSGQKEEERRGRETHMSTDSGGERRATGRGLSAGRGLARRLSIIAKVAQLRSSGGLALLPELAELASLLRAASADVLDVLVVGVGEEGGGNRCLLESVRHVEC
jgi:hypothetical protein